MVPFLDNHWIQQFGFLCSSKKMESSGGSVLESTQESIMEDRLRYILSTVNEWIKFAEAKNGALLGVDIAILFGFLQFISDTSSIAWTYFAISLIGLSAISALLSFIPQLKEPSFLKRKGGDKETSLIFYGHLAKNEPENYIRSLYSGVGMEISSIASIELDYARQIITNSQVALRKNRYFSVGLWFTMVGLLLFLLPLLISAVGTR